jgi:phosphoribosylformylglycinamidine synthase
VRSKEWIVRQYDHEVQGQTVIKPLVGVLNDGPGDASIIAPALGSFTAVAVSCGMNPKYNDIDPYHGTACAIDEALRNLTAVGAPIERTAILDNYCWGNTASREQLGTLTRASLACYDYAVGFGVPFISGKDSLNNEFATPKGTIAIPPTLLISAMAVMEDARQAVTMDLKEPGNVVYLVGATWPELGGSHYLELLGLRGTTVPQVRLPGARETMSLLGAAIRDGLVRACHDLSEGGLGVAAAEMAFAGNLGLSLDLREVPFAGPDQFRLDPVLLFSESASRFLVEVAPCRVAEFEDRLGSTAMGRLGPVHDAATAGTDAAALEIIGVGGNTVLRTPVEELKAAWQTPLLQH